MRHEWSILGQLLIGCLLITGSYQTLNDISSDDDLRELLESIKHNPYLRGKFLRMASRWLKSTAEDDADKRTTGWNRNFPKAECEKQQAKDTGYTTRSGSLLPSSPSCGQSTLTKSGTVEERVVNGQKAHQGELPWTAAVGNKSSHVGPYCGGALIHPQWVLTAAHCFEEENYPCDLNVRLGVIDLTDSGSHLVDIDVEKIVKHPDYEKKSDNNDIALLKLAHPVVLSDNVNVACLPSPDVQFEFGHTCIVAGWGRTAESSKTSKSSPKKNPSIIPKSLRYAYIPLVESDKCEASFKRTAGLTLRVGDICAGFFDGSTDACQGDSGGPLVCEQGGRYYHVGVVSWGLGCAREGLPGIYTGVGQYYDWITSVIKRN